MPIDEQHPQSAGTTRELLQRGADILRPVLEPYGFHFDVLREGSGSGGSFAAGRFARRDQWLELHLRYSLGLVTYHWGNDAISHADYMRRLGVKGQYPGFSDDPLDGFRHLRADLPNATEFLQGADQEAFRAACRWASDPAARRLPP